MRKRRAKNDKGCEKERIHCRAVSFIVEIVGKYEPPSDPVRAVGHSAKSNSTAKLQAATTYLRLSRCVQRSFLRLAFDLKTRGAQEQS